MGIHMLSLPRGRVFVQLSLTGDWGFELEKFSTVLKKNAAISRFVSKKVEAACKNHKCLLYLYVGRPFLVILVKLSGHPRVIFANTRS